MEYAILISLHLLGAAIWTGGHMILALGILPGALRSRNVDAVRQFEEKYERIGIPALLVQALTGLRLAYLFLPDWSQWLSFESRVSTHIALKLTLLGLTLILAMHARFRLIPQLGEHNLRFLASHIIAVTILAVLFVLVGVSMRIGGLGDNETSVIIPTIDCRCLARWRVCANRTR